MEIFGVTIAEKAEGVVERFEDKVAWGSFEPNHLGLETFDIPISLEHHAVGDRIVWFKAEDAEDGNIIMIISGDFASVFRTEPDTEKGFAIKDGFIINRDCEMVAYYE